MKKIIKKIKKSKLNILAVIIIIPGAFFLLNSLEFDNEIYIDNKIDDITEDIKQIANIKSPQVEALDTKEYDARLLDLAHYIFPTSAPDTTTNTTESESNVITNALTDQIRSGTFDSATSDANQRDLPVYSKDTNVKVPGELWPPAAPYPNSGAILPFKRILAYYGNFYSTKMGILGEYEPDEVLRRLEIEKQNWEKADPETPVQLAIEYIAMVAQASAGTDGMYRAMMPDEEIEKAYELAQKADAILILDLQIGLSTIERELPKFDKYMERPDAHIALDPEFSMKSGDKPGDVIGTFSAKDINYTINHLSDIVKENNLPPKVLLVHRFTQKMVTEYDQIKPTPEVQVVMVMDGWGSVGLKQGTYRQVIEPEPVQFAGIKIFYKNDLKPPSTGLMTPSEVLLLNPKPIYIQYQ